MVDLLGYDIFEQIYAGSKTLVYRGQRQCDRQPVILKLLNPEYPTFSELLQFRNQYTIAKNLDLPGIVRPYSLESYRNGYALVMEDWGGLSLNHAKVQLDPLTLDEILSIAIQLAEILHGLHQNRVIHKDIKPANILIHPQSKQVKLIDFSIASLLPKETQEIKNPNGLEGTLAYISPEQTGRMNRGIDYRTDFYSLGVTLFELLAGQLPFSSNNPMELVHCHIAKIPPALGSREQATGNREKIPSVLAEIVMKLMAKNAEERYQSALGLKFDLENCLLQLKESGQIETFEIGTRDVCDRFTIPEKLYGREMEVQTLLEAFDRVASPPENRVANGTSELMLVAGFSGIGKTAIVNEVHKPIVRQQGYFIKGKFDQFNRNIPFWALVQAFRDLMGQLLSESDAQLQTWKIKILEVLGDNAKVIIDVIPELERIIGSQPPTPELSGTAAQNRFNLLFQKFIQVFATKEHPLVMFLDDLQWADSASLTLMQLLMGEARTGYLLAIGAYRDNEVFPAHPLMLTLDEMEKAGATVNTITLKPLSEVSLNQLVTETLACPIAVAQPLTELVYQKTKGNPFFATQFLKALHQDRSIAFDLQAGHWQCDITQVREAALTDDVVEFMATQLQKLPAQTQDVLKLAACIGNQFDLSTLAIVSECSQTDAATHLWKALQEGLILPQSEVYKFYQDSDSATPMLRDRSQPLSIPDRQLPTYKFLHDRVQQAAYSLIPESQKQATHLQIGQLLQQNLSAEEREEKRFDLVGHLNLGQALIDRPSQREELARLNLAAGEKARKATAYAAAQVYLQTGIELLTANCWQNQYELTLNLHVAAAEAAYLNADLDRMNSISAVVLEQAQTVLDKVKIYEIQIAVQTSRGRMLEAIAASRPALAQLGIELPAEPSEAEIGQALQSLAEQFQGKSIEQLLDRPEMTDPQALAAMQLLSAIFAPIFMGMPSLLPSLSETIVRLSLQFGNSPVSAVGYIGYGVLLCTALGDPETSYRFGQLAMNVLDRFNAQKLQPIITVLFGGCIQYRQEALRATISTQKRGFRAGMETGEFVYAGYNLVNAAAAGFFAGVELDTLEPEIDGYRAAMVQTKQDSARTYLDMFGQMMLNLTEVASQPHNLVGTFYDETVMFPKHERDNELTAFVFAYVFKLLLAYSFGNYRAALDYVAQISRYERALAGTPFTAVFNYYAALAHLEIFSAEPERVEILTQVQTHQTILHEWAQTAPMNYLHKWYLVEAQRQQVLGHRTEAIDLFDRAISLAKEHQYLHEEALANELAAKFYLNWDKEKVAAGYMQEAYYCYAKWGAKAKTDDLLNCYPDLLRPVVQQVAPTLNPLETLASFSEAVPKGIVVPHFSIHTSTQTQTNCSASTSTDINTVLDFSAIIKASQSLSGTIQLDELIHQLTQIILQHSGADRCALILPNSNGQCQLKAVATPESTQLCEEPLEGNSRLPVKLIQYVKHTETLVIIDNLDTDLPVIGEYLMRQRPKSVLCLPILDRGHLRGILSLENRATTGVFTSDRLLVLHFLCTQAAISLENARLYQQAQDYAQQLEQSQLQLVQSEKMSALGNLVAGVAHEINNPVGFIAGNLKPAQDYVQDLLGLIDLYQEKMPNPDEEIEEEIDTIDLDFIRDDLPKLIGSMKEGTDRISHISTSLRTFSRADSDRPTLFNLHEGIDSTLLILKHRLKVSDRRPAIETIKHYGNLPEVSCFAGQLNQVFMNIIANAIDALDEGCEKGEINRPCIQIYTEAIEHSAIVRIKDNGMGMPDEVKSKIFDHLFTTKDVGKGTGLGLAIARQIIEEKHGGKLSVTSTVGQGTEFAIVLPHS